MNTWLAAFPCVHGVWLVDPPSVFEERYGTIRAKEDRIISDDQLRRLPHGQGLWNIAEWKIRARSAQRLADALAKQGTSLRILEVGCGNGWLSAYLHRCGHEVVGIDPFTTELEQAARVFPGGAIFVRMDPFNAVLPTATFDSVLFAASIQYFYDAAAIVQRALDLCVPCGTVHVLDTVLYPDAVSANAAQQRSHGYYARMNAPDMAAHYAAHQLSALTQFPNAAILHAPDRFRSLCELVGIPTSPFTHVALRKA